MLESPNKVSGVQKEIFEWIESVIMALAVVVLIFTFCFRVVMIEGRSMNPTLYDGERVILNSMFYEPKYGDIVVITQENGFHKPLIKRVIATEGQTIDIDFDLGKVYVDGVALDEPYVASPTTDREDFTGPIIIPENMVFVMGDNRNASTDSRSSMVGLVKEDYIMGKVLFRVFPLSKFGGLYKYE